MCCLSVVYGTSEHVNRNELCLFGLDEVAAGATSVANCIDFVSG